MRSRQGRWMVMAMVAATAAPAVAGDGHKCTKAAQACLDAMAASLREKGWAGLELDKSEGGTLTVKAVVAGSPAEAAGFRKGDVLVALNAVKLGDEKNREALYAQKKKLTPGARATYTVHRDGAPRTLVVTLAAMPDDVRAAYVGEHMLQHASPRTAEK